MRNTIAKIRKKYITVCQLAGASIRAPSDRQLQIMLFGVGVILLSSGLTKTVDAQLGGGIGGGSSIDYNDTRLCDFVNAMFLYIEGTFGALIMVSAGIGAILSSAFGQYRASLSLLVVAVGAFILRSLVGTFFNDSCIAP